MSTGGTEDIGNVLEGNVLRRESIEYGLDRLKIDLRCDLAASKYAP